MSQGQTEARSKSDPLLTAQAQPRTWRPRPGACRAARRRKRPRCRTSPRGGSSLLVRNCATAVAKAHGRHGSARATVCNRLESRSGGGIAAYVSSRWGEVPHENYRQNHYEDRDAHFLARHQSGSCTQQRDLFVTSWQRRARTRRGTGGTSGEGHGGRTERRLTPIQSVHGRPVYLLPRTGTRRRRIA